jgi:hypothetical protein
MADLARRSTTLTTLRPYGLSILRWTTLSLLAIVIVLTTIGKAYALPKQQNLPPAQTNNVSITLDFQTDGVAINLRRIDFWEDYLVFVGTATASNAECISRDDFALQVGDELYAPAPRSTTN